jgi:hypothetical protein
MTGVETFLGAGLAKNIGEHGEVNLSLVEDPAVILPLLSLGLLALIPILVNSLRNRPKRA